MTYLLLPSQVEVLQEEVAYATEEVERLTKVLDEQNSLLQASQEQTAQKDAVIHQLEQKVKSDRTDQKSSSSGLMPFYANVSFVPDQTAT